MPTKISGRDIMKMKDHFQGLAKRTEGMKKKGEETIEHLVSAAEVSASAFTLGAIQGKYGPVEVVGVPIDLLAAGVLHVGGFLGVAGKASNHLHAFADGALASFFFTMGRGAGVNWKNGRPILPPSGKTKVAGEVSDRDIAALT